MFIIAATLTTVCLGTLAALIVKAPEAYETEHGLNVVVQPRRRQRTPLIVPAPQTALHKSF